MSGQNDQNEQAQGQGGGADTSLAVIPSDAKPEASRAMDFLDVDAADRFDARAAEKEREALELRGRVAMLERELSRLTAAVRELIDFAGGEPKGKACAELAQAYLTGKLDETLPG